MKVARNRDGSLFLIPDFGSVQRNETTGTWNFYTFHSNMGNGCMYFPATIDSHLFQDLTWEDEPIEVEITQKETNKPMKKTIIVNLFAGPGCGKSTGAAWLFSQLKLQGVDCEYVSEFAKDKVWENNDEVFKCQFYVTGKQAFKISRCFGKVDVIITDSPIAIGAQYTGSEKLADAILEEFTKYELNNLNVLLKRVKPYNPNGRHQTEDEAVVIDMGTQRWLDVNNIRYMTANGDEEGYREILNEIISRLNKK